VQLRKSHDFQIPHWLRQAVTTLAHSHFSRGAFYADSVLSPDQVWRAHSGLTAHFPCGMAGWVGCNRERNRGRPLSGETNSCWQKFLKCCVSVIRYRNPSRRRERPGTRKAHAGTRPMRTNLWYSPARCRARAKVTTFLHRRTW